ncbi:MAG: hypothetical protein ILP19_06770 [Oscillospiraceae bacterium]|nr:hypothetical protein [Oscillospiraceae bacterium]
MSDKNYSLDDILGEYKPSGSSGDSLDDILSSYPATKSYDSELAQILDRPDDALSVSDFNISTPANYPSPEEIKKKAENITLVPDEELSEEDRKKKSKQISYEIMSGDYERKNVPDDLKTSIELEAERLEREEQAKKEEKKRKKVRPKPVKKSYGLDLLGDIKGVHSTFDDDDDEFEKKYGNTPLFTDEERDELIGEEHKLPDDLTFEPDSGHSLSEKMELLEYEDKYLDYKPNEEPVRPQPVKTEKPVPGPFDKYSDLEYDLENILKQYETKEKKVSSDTSPLRNFSGIFNKLIAKDDDGVGELGSQKVHRTPEVKPISRKQIGDISLDLSDKVLQDTSSFKVSGSDADKISQLKASRSQKVRDFKLEGSEDEPEEEVYIEEDPDTPEVIDDFRSLNDAPSIANHIEMQRKKLLVRLFALIGCLVLTGLAAFANDFEELMMPLLKNLTFIDKRLHPDTFLFINTIIGVIAGIVCSQTISSGLTKLSQLKADCDSISSLALLTSVVTSCVSISYTNVIRGSYACVYIPVAIGSLVINTIGKLFIIERTRRSFANISGENEHYALFMMKEDNERAVNFTRGAITDLPNLAGMRKTEVITNFLRNSYSSDSTDSFCKRMAPFIVGSGLIIGILAGLMAKTEHGSLGALCIGLSAFSAVCAACACFPIMLVVNLPMNALSKRCAQKQGAVIGFDSIDEFSGTNSVLVDAAQLFPAGSIKLMNIKSFFNTSMDEAILQAASLTHQSGSILDNMFYEIICGKTEMLDHVESYLYEDSMGLCGWINNKRVLLGNRDLMINHSIEGLPSAVKEQEYTKNNRIAVYLSISGQLSAMFIIELVPAYQIAETLKALEKRNVAVMLRSVDSMLSVNTLCDLFDVSPSMFRLIPFRYHSDYNETVDFTASSDATLACTGRFSAFAELILGVKKLHSVISIGLASQVAEILVGILLVLFMVLIKNMQELSVTFMMMYNLIFTAVYLIFVTVVYGMNPRDQFDK